MVYRRLLKFLPFAPVVAGIFLLTPALPAYAAGCTPAASAGGYFFDNYEQVEYVNGLLVYHFKVKAPYTDGRFWQNSFRVFNDECAAGSVQPALKWVSLTPGVQSFSVRFTSQTHFEIWNDQTNVKETCANCVQDIAAFPGYYEFAFSGIIDGGSSALQSSSHRIQSAAADPPVSTGQLQTPQGCTSFQTDGTNKYFFDDYERSEYVNGLLVYHFRLKSPFNDGRQWGSQVFLHDQNCAIGTQNPATRNTAITPYARYFSVRFSSPTHYDVWNDESNQKETCAACSADIPATLPDGSAYQYISLRGVIDGGASGFRSTPFPIKEPPLFTLPDPVIIVPGILGSSDKNGVWVIDPIFHVYDNLIETLKANGYTEGLDLFTMPYDWRQSNVLTAVELEQKIGEVKQICKCQKVDLIAHSMGGLVARQYIQSSRYQGDVDQLIFLGTPHLGAPKDYLAWEGGENDTDGVSKFIKFVFSQEARKAGYRDTFDYVRNKPIVSVQQLLPIFDYLRDKGDADLRIYPSGYPSNTFIENLSSTVNNLLTSGVRTSNIVGSTTATTINSIRVVVSQNLPKWEHGYPDGFDDLTPDRGLERGEGDGTVPVQSGSFIQQDLTTINSEHTELPTKAEGAVFKKLTGKDPVTLVDKFHFINGKLLIIKILSPVDIVVIAPGGKKIGKDFQNNQEINEIDGAFYSGFQTDDEYVTIPNPIDGEYKIQTQGTGAGSYTVATGFITDATSSEQNFTGQTQPGMSTELDLNLNTANSGTIIITPLDQTPPQIRINSPQATDYPRSQSLPISVDITDVDSGVASQEIRFDGNMVQNGAPADLFFQKLGAHQLRASANDFVGNTANSTVTFRVIATFASTISDIERAYNLGWITKKDTKTVLTKTIQAASLVKGTGRKLLLAASLIELEIQRKYLNTAAYNLLKEDVLWLLSN